MVLSNNGGNHNATMYEGAEICNNKAEQTGGGAMISKGVFTMNGGTISGNISGTNSAKGAADRIGGGVFVRRGGQFIMNGGAIENNATTAFGGGVCFDASDYGGTVPKIELNAGTIKNNLMQAPSVTNIRSQAAYQMIWLSPVKTMESAIVTSISPVRQLLEIRQFISRLAVRP